MLARASGLFRMCAEAGIEWELVTDTQKEDSALFGASTLNLAPPIIKDDQMTLSQSVACHTYLGGKLGFDKGIPLPELALQYILDLDDLHNELKGAAIAGVVSKDVKALREYLEGDRYKTHLATINRQIKGPFYFGNDPTYVDFFAVSMFEMCEGRWLNVLKDKAGDTINEHAPKLRLVLDEIRGLQSASKLKEIPPLLPSRVITQDRVATWQD